MSPTLLLVLGVAILVLLLVFRLVLRFQRQRVRGHARVGRRAEAQGLRLLERQGYTLLQRQPLGELVLEVDGRRLAFGVRADALVERGGRRYVAEIKGGEEAADLGTRATRRQLLEYSHAFGADEVLLVDVPGGRVLRVRFPR